jgi:hypothetical protein
MGSAIDYLFQNDAEREAMGKNGIEFVGRNFTVAGYWANMERQLQSVAKTDTLDFGSSEPEAH